VRQERIKIVELSVEENDYFIKFESSTVKWRRGRYRGRVGGGKTGGGKSGGSTSSANASSTNNKGKSQGKFSLLSGEDSAASPKSGDSADENHTASEVLEKTGTSTLIDELVAFVQQQPSKALPIDKLQFFYGTCKRLDTKQKRQNWDINASIKESKGRLILDKVNTKTYIVFVDVKSKFDQPSSKCGGSAIKGTSDKTRAVSEAPQEVRVAQDVNFWEPESFVREDLIANAAKAEKERSVKIQVDNKARNKASAPAVRTICPKFSKAGSCAFGSNCKFEHASSAAVSSGVASVVKIDRHGGRGVEGGQVGGHGGQGGGEKDNNATTITTTATTITGGGSSKTASDARNETLAPAVRTICPKFAKTGSCAFGSNCKFEHASSATVSSGVGSEVRIDQPTIAGGGTSTKSETSKISKIEEPNSVRISGGIVAYSSKFCVDFLKGYCKNGNNCRFPHN
jgi:hypothetical protein